jgi:hypothetical protein
MKAVLFILVLFLVSVLPASADTSQVNGTGPARIDELYSDTQSFDVTLFSVQTEENLTLEVSLVRPGKNEDVVATQSFSTGSLPANVRVTKVGFWNVKNAERGAYALKARLLEQDQVLSESRYDFVYGSNSASRANVNDLVPNSEGISVLLSPNQEASFLDIEYMLIDGHDVIYETKTEKASLTSVPENFSASWGSLLENNKKYAGRVKIQVYSPNLGFIASTENFTARDDAEITDIYQDETGASATVLGRSQVPFEGSLAFSVYEVQETSGQRSYLPVESIHERVPVLLAGDDETVEVAWKERLTEGIYRLEIELIGNDGDVIERRETIIESDLPPSNTSETNTDSGNGTSNESGGNGMPGFSVAFGVAGLTMVFALFKKLR